MKFAVIGAAHGHIYEFIDDMLGMGNEFTGIYNDRSQLVPQISQKYNVPIFDDLELLFATGAEIAGTSAVNSRKIEIIEECSRHGVHIIADKPIVINEEQYERLEEVIRQGRIEVGMMLSVRFDPFAAAVKKVVESGTIGRLISVEIFNPHRLGAWNRPDWHFERELNGGIVIDLIVHSVDLFNWLTGSEITECHGVAVKSILPEKKSFYDCSQFFVSSSEGTTGYFRVDWHMTDSHWTWGDLRIFCTGSRGSLEARMVGDPLTREPLVVLFEEGRETRKLEPVDCGRSITRDFIDRIMGKEYTVGHEDILKATKNSIDFDRQARKISFI